MPTQPIMLDDPSVMRNPRQNNGWRNPNIARPPGLRHTDEGVTRDVQENELSQTHLNNMTDQGGRYITSARGRAARGAASRGMLNSSMAQGAAEAAAIDAAAPFALSDADAYRQAAGQNLDSVARQRISDEGNATTRYTSDNSVGAQLRIANANIMSNEAEAERERQDRQRDRDWRTSERTGEQDWQSSEANLDRQEARRAYRTQTRTAAAAATLGTVLGNPEYFRDPAGAAGAIQFYTDYWDQLFPPEPDDGGTP